MLFDPVRSADPPSVSGTAALTTSSTISDDLRVATFGAASDCALRKAISAPASFFGSVAGSHPLELGALARRRASRAAPPRPSALAAPRAPIAVQAARTSSGTSNGGYGQP